MAASPGTATIIEEASRFCTLITDATTGLSNAVLSDTGLSIPLTDIVSTNVSAPAYEFEFFATFTTNATADAKFGLSAPSGWTASWGAAKDLGVATATTGPTALAIGDALSVGGAATTVLSQVLAKGFLIGDTTHTGSFKIQFAQDTSNGTDALVLKAFKTYLRLTHLN